jgi:hypothetical protein
MLYRPLTLALSREGRVDVTEWQSKIPLPSRERVRVRGLI